MLPDRRRTAISLSAARRCCNKHTPLRPRRAASLGSRSITAGRHRTSFRELTTYSDSMVSVPPVNSPPQPLFLPMTARRCRVSNLNCWSSYQRCAWRIDVDINYTCLYVDSVYTYKYIYIERERYQDSFARTISCFNRDRRSR